MSSRLNFNIDDELLARVDLYAEKMSLNRTAAIHFLLTQGLQYIDALDMMPKIFNMLDVNTDVKK